MYLNVNLGLFPTNYALYIIHPSRDMLNIYSARQTTEQDDSTPHPYSSPKPFIRHQTQEDNVFCSGFGNRAGHCDNGSLSILSGYKCAQQSNGMHSAAGEAAVH